jgi:hypothetical protein
MEFYEKVKNFCTTNNCNLLTTFDEFEEKQKTVLDNSKHYVRIDFIGVCGHNSSAVVTNFLNRKTGIRCKDCVKKDTCKIQKCRNKESSQIEYESINIIKEYLLNDYEIIRTKEGCKADIILKHKNNSNKYWPVQVKGTKELVHKMYAFGNVNKNYDNMLIICICTSEKKLWIAPYEDINHVKKLNISTRSKYNKYLVKDNMKLKDEIEKYDIKYTRNSIDDLLIPNALLQQREQEYVAKREKYVNFLEYIYPEIQNTPTDFIANGKKVQEKVAGINMNRKKQNLIVHLASNNGKKENGNRQFRTYRKGENDYYWFHSSIDDRFWIVPESILFENKYISKEDETQNKKVLTITAIKNNWIKDYEYDYNTFNKDKIMELFK